MSMVRLSELRKKGVIPAKQHDAFLLALLLAVLANIAFFIVQALLPKIALLISLLGATPAPPPDLDKQMPFVLVDPSLFQEVDPNLPAEAEGSVSREASQTEERPDLPEDSPFVQQGADLILTAPEGTLDPPAPQGNAPQDQDAQNEPISDQQLTDQPEEVAEQLPDEALPELPQLLDEPEPIAEQQPAEQPQQEVVPENEVPEPMVEPTLQDVPPPAPEPEPQPEPQPEPEPEPAPEPQPEPEPVQEPVPEPEPEPIVEPETTPIAEETLPEETPDTPTDMLNLAMLPISPEGFIDPQPSESLSRPPVEPAELPQQLQQRLEPAPPEPQQLQQPQPLQPPVPPAQPPQPQRDRPQPVFKKIGGENRATGAPLRRNQETSIKFIGEEASMRILQHRWGQYMAKVARQLQESLNRQMILSPTLYSTGQVKIRFGIAPDGSLSFYRTEFPLDSMEAERILSERMLKEAAPFDPLTAEMQKDENFQNMTVVVNLM